MNGIVKVSLWGTVVGYLGYAPGGNDYAVFEYDPDFIRSGIQVSPVQVKYPPERFVFDRLSRASFMGVPGFIADSLPDSYGNQLIDIYMAEKNIPASRVTTLDRLLYVSDRAMGALEYHPGEKLPLYRPALDLRQLSELAELVLRSKEKLHEKLSSAQDRSAALAMIRIGSSAGGARSKALVALSSKGTILDGTVNHGPDYSYWLLKFDSSDPPGMPTVEYIYSRIAERCGIEMTETRLIDDGDKKHFLIKRFDRIIGNNRLDKLHYASWAGLGHADRDGANSYEQLVLLSRQLGLGREAETKIFRRAVFNILGRNQDDHTKNFGFLMDRAGAWRLAPAFDLTYSCDEGGRWTRNHQSWLNGKNNGFELKDLLAFGAYCNLGEKKSREIVIQVKEAFSGFPAMAKRWGVPVDLIKYIEANLRLNL